MNDPNDPDKLDALLFDILNHNEAEIPTNDSIGTEYREFVQHAMGSVEKGSRAIFVVIHPNDRSMQYMLLNSNRVKALGLIAEVLNRTAMSLESDDDDDTASA
jgi:hypothetical protein